MNVPVRSTIIRLKDGGLFINNPVAPTIECIEYVRALEAEHGNVKYIVLSSLAIEHKGTSGAFSRYFPESVIYVQPGQYTFPINLPVALFYPFRKVIKEIPESSSDAPWGEEIDHQVLGPLKPPGVCHPIYSPIHSPIYNNHHQCHHSISSHSKVFYTHCYSIVC